MILRPPSPSRFLGFLISFPSFSFFFFSLWFQYPFPFFFLFRYHDQPSFFSSSSSSCYPCLFFLRLLLLRDDGHVCPYTNEGGHCENTNLPSSLLTISVSCLLFPLSRVFLFFFSLCFFARYDEYVVHASMMVLRGRWAEWTIIGQADQRTNQFSSQHISPSFFSFSSFFYIIHSFIINSFPRFLHHYHSFSSSFLRSWRPPIHLFHLVYHQESTHTKHKHLTFLLLLIFIFHSSIHSFIHPLVPYSSFLALESHRFISWYRRENTLTKDNMLDIWLKW